MSKCAVVTALLPPLPCLLLLLFTPGKKHFCRCFLVVVLYLSSSPRCDVCPQFIYRVGSLWLDLGISSVVVVGGCGDFFDVHDTALLVDNYLVSDATERAHSVSDNPLLELCTPSIYVKVLYQAVSSDRYSVSSKLLVMLMCFDTIAPSS